MENESLSWLELFFDLVVVAAVAVLTEGLLEDPSPQALGLAAVGYGTIWMSWMLVVLYANVASAQTRIRVVMIAMLLVAVMTASVPLHHADHANLFVAAFLLTRGAIAGNARETGRLLATVPLLQLGGASLPWIASFWVHEPAKYWVWAGALLVDLVFLVAHHELRQEDLERMRPRHGRREQGELVVVDVDRDHLDERLGLFVIIVLGEAVVQLVVAAAVREWEGGFALTALACFGLLVGLWWLAFVRSVRGLRAMTPRLLLPLHLLSTLGLVGVAAGIAALVGSDARLEPAVRWALCGGLALHLAVVAALVTGPLRRWALPAAAFPLAVGAFAGGATHRGLALLLLVPVAVLAARGRAIPRPEPG